MELGIPGCFKRNFWRLFPIVMILMSMNEIIYGMGLQSFGLNELEDIGRIIFVFLVKACESALITVLLIWIYSKINSGYKNS